MTFTFEIPEVDTEVIEELAGRIIPVAPTGGYFQYLLKSEINENPFDPQFYFGIRTPRVERFGRTITFHSFIDEDVFQPTVAEILCQIPRGPLENMFGYYTEQGNSIIPDFEAHEARATESGIHLATTSFFRLC